MFGKKPHADSSETLNPTAGKRSWSRSKRAVTFVSAAALAAAGITALNVVTAPAAQAFAPGDTTDGTYPLWASPYTYNMTLGTGTEGQFALSQLNVAANIEGYAAYCIEPYQESAGDGNYTVMDASTETLIAANNRTYTPTLQQWSMWSFLLNSDPKVTVDAATDAQKEQILAKQAVIWTISEHPDMLLSAEGIARIQSAIGLNATNGSTDNIKAWVKTYAEQAANYWTTIVKPVFVDKTTAAGTGFYATEAAATTNAVNISTFPQGTSIDLGLKSPQFKVDASTLTGGLKLNAAGTAVEIPADTAPGTYKIRVGLQSPAIWKFTQDRAMQVVATPDGPTMNYIDQYIVVKTSPIELGTTATDKADNDKSIAFEGGNVKDIVAYKYLRPNTQYQVFGELVDKATGQRVGGLVAQAFTSSATGTGTWEMTLPVPAGQAGKTLVAKEYLYNVADVNNPGTGATPKDGKTHIASHADINDAAQTVTVGVNGALATTAVDKADADKTVASVNGIVKDTVTYSGLPANTTYHLIGKLMDKATNTQVGVWHGASVTTSATGAGTWTLDLPVPAGSANKNLVAFEYLFTPGSAEGTIELPTSIKSTGVQVAIHADINDAAQTVAVGPAPSIGTTATDAADGDKTIVGAGGVIRDKISYKDIPVGRYVTVGRLFDKATGQYLGVQNTNIFSVTDRATFEFSLDFPVTTAMAGKNIVVFEYLYNVTDVTGSGQSAVIKDGAVPVVQHADINDAAQTVALGTAPALATVASDKADADKVIASAGGTVNDVVTYSNLTPNTSYQLYGYLTDKATGTRVGTPVAKLFTSSATGSGTVTMELPVGAGNNGKTLVASEFVFLPSAVTNPGTNPTIADADLTKAIAAHNDINDAAQTVTVQLNPTMATVASDNSDGDKVVPSYFGKVKDVITYKDLAPNKEFQLVGKLVDKATGAEVGSWVGAKVTTSATGAGTWDLVLPVPATAAGKDLVVFEYLFNLGATEGTETAPTAVKAGQTPVISHADINDAAQTVKIGGTPSLVTTATDKVDGDKVLPAAGGVIKDVVTYTNLPANTDYQLVGTLNDKVTGAEVGSWAGKLVKTSATGSGTFELEITVPAGQAGKELVVFEHLAYPWQIDAPGTNPTRIIYYSWQFMHRDINDAAQTVKITQNPQLATTATDAADGDKAILGAGGVIRDKVSYKDIPVGRYVTVGRLFDKATGQYLGVQNTNIFSVTDRTTFEFNIDFPVTSALAGKDIVVFEYLYNVADVTGSGQAAVIKDGAKPVVQHADINDAAQTVKVGAAPSLATVATDKADADKIVTTTGATVSDVVTYTNLKPNTEYQLYGFLRDKATSVQVGSGVGQLFTTTASGSGSVTMDIPVAAGQAGKSLVAAEYVFEKSAVTNPGATPTVTLTAALAKHDDINSAPQTVTVDKVVELKTNLVDTKDTDKIVNIGSTVTDTVTYKGLRVGATYTIAGTLMDKATGQATTSTSVATFTATAADGSVNLVFEVPAALRGKTLVAFEKAYFASDVTVAGVTVTPKAGKTPIATHEDINDAAQTVTVPGLVTTATDKADGDKTVVIGGVVTDKVDYTGLEAGKSYTLKAELMNKSTGATTGIVAWKTFTATTANGSVNIELPAEQKINGLTVVAFETLYNAADVVNNVPKAGATPVGEHKDINSAAQTVGVNLTPPSLKTVATDKADGDKSIAATGGVISDKVTYTNLTAGTYVTVGRLMDKATNTYVGVQATNTFTADGTGTIEKTIEFPVTQALGGKDLVVFETLYKATDVTGSGQDAVVKAGATAVASHADINDAAQTVNMVDTTVALKTTATDTKDGDKVINVGSTVKDVVEYTSARVGVQYVLAGELMDKATGASTGVKQAVTFTPTTANGSVTLTFPAAPELAGKTLVAFEKLYYATDVTVVNGVVTPKAGKTAIGTHTDINDAAQTVTVPSLETVATDPNGGDKEVTNWIVDEVTYTGLTAGKTYVMHAELFDKATGQSLGVYSSMVFVAAASSGTVRLTIPVPANLAGKTVVVFESVYNSEDVVVGKHLNVTIRPDRTAVVVEKDINNSDQTVKVAG